MYRLSGVPHFHTKCWDAADEARPGTVKRDESCTSGELGDDLLITTSWKSKRKNRTGNRESRHQESKYDKMLELNLRSRAENFAQNSPEAALRPGPQRSFFEVTS